MLSQRSLEELLDAVKRRSLTGVAKTLGVHRHSLAAVLCGRGRVSTTRAVAAAFVEKAAELAP